MPSEPNCPIALKVYVVVSAVVVEVRIPCPSLWIVPSGLVTLLTVKTFVVFMPPLNVEFPI